MQCSSTNEDNSEVIDMDKIVPKAEGTYDYSKKDSIKETNEKHPFIKSISHFFNNDAESIENKDFDDTWRYMPDRLSSDSSLHKVFRLDSTLFVYRMWQYSDSIHSINAFYNWLDCFGPSCKGIEIGDSVNISKESFLLFQDNKSIHFVKSNNSLNEKKWKQAIPDKKNTSWDYLIKQRPEGTLEWIITPD